MLFFLQKRIFECSVLPNALLLPPSQRAAQVLAKEKLWPLCLKADSPLLAAATAAKLSPSDCVPLADLAEQLLTHQQQQLKDYSGARRWRRRLFSRAGVPLYCCSPVLLFCCTTVMLYLCTAVLLLWWAAADTPAADTPAAAAAAAEGLLGVRVCCVPAHCSAPLHCTAEPVSALLLLL